MEYNVTKDWSGAEQRCRSYSRIGPRWKDYPQVRQIGIQQAPSVLPGLTSMYAENDQDRNCDM